MAKTGRRFWMIATAAAAILLLVFALQHKTRTQPTSPYRQLTFEENAGSPSLSPDGKQIAYCVGSGRPERRNLWIRDTDSQFPPRRLTDDPWNDYDPWFSPDGAFVYFTSDRPEEGVYRVASVGGAAELVRAHAITPRFSPDGRWFLFNGVGGLNVTPAGGGPARALTGSLTNCFAPLWSPDSRSILFACGMASQMHEWYIASLDRDGPQPTGLADTFVRRGFNYVEAEAWLPSNELIFAGRQGETMTLWRIGFEPSTRTITRAPERATDATGDTGATFAAGLLGFGRTTVSLNLWSLPVDSAGRVSGPPERLTATPNQKGSASISRDGRTLLYSVEQDGAFSLVARDVPSGKEREVTYGAFFAALRPDGARFAFARGVMDRADVFSHGIARWWRWWFARSICVACGVPRGFTPDGRSILLWADSERDDHVDLADVSSGRTRRLLSAAPSRWIYAPQLSPDGRAIVFGVRSRENEYESWIAPVHPDSATAESEWVPLMGRSGTYHIPFWSADGRLLYLLSNHGGGNLKWLEAQPVDGGALRLSGTRRALYEFQEPRVPMMDPLWNPVMSVPGRILIEMGDMTTNVWIGSRI